MNGLPVNKDNELEKEPSPLLIRIGMTTSILLYHVSEWTEKAAGALIQETFDVIVILNALRAGKATF